MPCIQDHWQRDMRERNSCIRSFQTGERVVNLFPPLTLYTDICIYWSVYLWEWPLWKGLHIKTLEVNSPLYKAWFWCLQIIMCVYLEGGYDFFLWGNHFFPLGQLSPYAKKQVLLVHRMNPFLLKHKGHIFIDIG